LIGPQGPKREGDLKTKGGLGSRRTAGRWERPIFVKASEGGGSKSTYLTTRRVITGKRGQDVGKICEFKKKMCGKRKTQNGKGGFPDDEVQGGCAVIEKKTAQGMGGEQGVKPGK